MGNRNKKIMKVLFSTKNHNRITAAFNSLSSRERQDILMDKKVKERLYKIANANILVTILIDLPFDFRNNFLKDINKENFSNEEKILIDFLLLSNYEDFDYKGLSDFEELKDRQILTLIFRKLSKNKLRDIILANYDQSINSLAFLEYSKKSPELYLELDLINTIEENTLIKELKRRHDKKQITKININDFLNLSLSKKNRIISICDDINLINDLIKVYQKKYTNTEPDELVKLFKSFLSDYSYVRRVEIQVIVSLLDDERALILMHLFFKNFLKFENDVEEKYLKLLLYNFRQLSSTTDNLYQLCKNEPDDEGYPKHRTKPFMIINYLNTGTIDNEIDKIFKDKITIEQYQKINQRKVNKIRRILTKIFYRSNDFSKKNAIILSYKLYMIFGYENTIDLLNFKYGYISYSTLLKLLANCNVKSVEFEKHGNSYEPLIYQELINFLIGDKKDNNTTIKRMLRGELAIIENKFAKLYNDFKRFQLIIGQKIHLNKLIPLLEENKIVLLPDEYKLTNDIFDNVIKSYKYSDALPEQLEKKVNEKECIINACEFYHENLERRLTSSIPRVYGKTEGNYSYEVLKLDDPIIMTLGYQTGCCFRMNGKAKEFLQYCSKSPHARVIIIKNPQNEICGMVPIIRNGNVINGNSIETNSSGEPHETYHALKCAFDDILEFSSCYEEEPIIACLVTNLKSNCFSKRRISKKVLPISSEPFYTNYDENTYIVSSNDDVTENDFKLYTPNSIYYDERPGILIYHWNMKDNQVINEIDKRMKYILYKLNEDPEKYTRYIKYIVCSEDWFLELNWDGITGKCLNKDPRAIEEFMAVKVYLKERFSNCDTYINFDDSNLSGGSVSSILPHKLVLDTTAKKDQVK